MIRMQCPGCGKTLKASEKYAGRSAQCPGCGQVVRLPRLKSEGGGGGVRAGVPGSPKHQKPPSAPPQPKPAPAPAVLAEDWLAMETAALSGPAAPLWDAPPSSPAPPPLRPAESRSLLQAFRYRGLLYSVFAITLVPLAVSLLGAQDRIEERLNRTLASQPDLKARIETDEEFSPDDLLDLLPGGKIEGAYLARDSQMHWLYAAISAVFFGVMLGALFPRGKATLMQLGAVAAFTGTFGILFLLCVQWLAEITQGWFLYGRSIIVLVFYIVKFIGFSYRAALDPDTGFLLSFFGFTFGVGLCEELTKTLPILFHFRSRATLDWRGACLWGLASGVGFGVAEGIHYSAEIYNGLATGDAYLVRFVSCVALHAIWSGSAAVMVWRRREWLQGDWRWAEMGWTLLAILAVPMVLHGLYDTLLKKEVEGWALVAALASLAWLVLLLEWNRPKETAWPVPTTQRAALA